VQPNAGRSVVRKHGVQTKNRRLEMKQCNRAKNTESKPFHIRTFQQIKKVERSAKLMSFFYGLVAFSSSVFVVSLYFPQVGALTVICAFIMISSQLFIRFIALEFLAGPKNATTKILNFSRAAVSQFRRMS